MTSNGLHFFLWSSHGVTVAAENNLYPVETGVRSVMFYGQNYTVINDTLLSEAFDYQGGNVPKFTGFEKLLLGCPTISHQDMETGKLKTLLPPMIFSVNTETDHTSLVPNSSVSYTHIMGLHYFRIGVTPDKKSFQVEENKKITPSSSNILPLSVPFS